MLSWDADDASLPENDRVDADGDDPHQGMERGPGDLRGWRRGFEEAKRGTPTAPGKPLRRNGSDQKTARGERNLSPRARARRKTPCVQPEHDPLWLRETRRRL